jgi:aspartyl-tRNA(Asn)/glutamyl-tRNA(Gln) amidotransferase subunit C
MITRQEVEHIARLARLKLSAKEEKEMTAHLQKILDYFNMLRDINTADVPLTVHVVECPNVFREDVAKPSLPIEEVLQNAPKRDSDFFIVPKVVDKVV